MKDSEPRDKAWAIAVIPFAAIMIWPFLLISFSAWVIQAVKAHAERPRPQVVAKDWRPDIPQCDKPLWDRIREGCDD